MGCYYGSLFHHDGDNGDRESWHQITRLQKLPRRISDTASIVGSCKNIDEIKFWIQMQYPNDI